MHEVAVTLITRPGCHLCDGARSVVTVECERLRASGIPIVLTEVDILGDAALARRYSEDIPVVQVQGKQHACWHVDPQRFAAAVEKAARRRRAE